MSGFTGSNAYILMTGDRAFFLTDPRYSLQARREVDARLFSIRIYKNKGLSEVSSLINKIKPSAVGFEGASLAYDDYARVKKALKGIRLCPASGIIRKVRARKDPFEVDRITGAARVLDEGFKAALRILRPGAIEKDAADKIEAIFKKKGGGHPAFDTIIASGARGAMAHAKASGKKIKKGELVVLDMGVLLDGYNSDETRTYCIGSPTLLQKKVYQTVLDAQKCAMAEIMPGSEASAVDRAARGYIKKAGYGRYFGHATGHGIGLDVHEAPVVGPRSADVLEEGMVVTVEPGIYIPGWGGVRIEDMVLVTGNGHEVLTKSPKIFSI
ncbi:MAG: aminopeptidase P family protein [Deltaproteobacteria bacterium]|nr:aminopeptidase P family protein [Deltaproteobacteria bacterium]